MTDPIAAVAGLNPQSLLAATRISACVCVAVSLGIPDLLTDGPKTAAALAAETGAQAGPLSRILRALTATGYLAEQANSFGLGPQGDSLLAGGDTSVHHWIRMFQEVSFFRSHAELKYTVMTGGSAYAHANGQEMFLHFAENPDVGAVFDRAMTFETAVIAPAVIESCAFSRFRSVADVGGSHGTLLAAVLTVNPHLHGILFDRSRVIPAAEAALAEAGLTDRTDCVAGSFFKSVPAADAYLLKNILHDWPDDRCIEILKCCRAAVNDDGRVLVVERVIGHGTDTSLQAICADLDMLVLGGADNARERSEEEYAGLFDASGLRLERIIPTDADLDYSVVEAAAV